MTGVKGARLGAIKSPLGTRDNGAGWLLGAGGGGGIGLLRSCPQTDPTPCHAAHCSAQHYLAKSVSRGSGASGHGACYTSGVRLIFLDIDGVAAHSAAVCQALQPHRGDRGKSRGLIIMAGQVAGRDAGNRSRLGSPIMGLSRTDGTKGLTERDAERAIDLLTEV